jgi:hypothetical protein
MIDHLTHSQLRSLLDDATQGEQGIGYLAHIETCPACASQLDDLLEGNLHAILGGSTPPLERDRNTRVEGRVFAQLHGLELVRQLLRLGMFGPATLIRGLLGPKTGPTRPRTEE